MTSKQGITPATPLNNEYSTIHSRIKRSCLNNNNISQDSSTSIAALESISSFYNYLDSCRNNVSPETDINDCFAVRLAFFLIDLISNRQFTLDKQGSFSKSFYRRCMISASDSGLAAEIDDKDLFIIYIKQCLHVLNACGILLRNGRLARINRSEASAATIYHKLFNAFWNKTQWEEIFPSDSESAKELKATKNILKDLILRRPGAVSIESVANEFFDLTGFSKKNNLLMISFLDFYFFTWLKHFGMIRYYKGRANAPVRITVTEIGRRSLNSF